MKSALIGMVILLALPSNGLLAKEEKAGEEISVSKTWKLPGVSNVYSSRSVVWSPNDKMISFFKKYQRNSSLCLYSFKDKKIIKEWVGELFHNPIFTHDNSTFLFLVSLWDKSGKSYRVQLVEVFLDGLGIPIRETRTNMNNLNSDSWRWSATDNKLVTYPGIPNDSLPISNKTTPFPKMEILTTTFSSGTVIKPGFKTKNGKYGAVLAKNPRQLNTGEIEYELESNYPTIKYFVIDDGVLKKSFYKAVVTNNGEKSTKVLPLDRSMTPNGRFFVYAKIKEDGLTYLSSKIMAEDLITGGKTELLVPEKTMPFHPVISHAGDKLAWVDDTKEDLYISTIVPAQNFIETKK